MVSHLVNAFEGLIERFLLSSTEFERKLRAVRSEQWTWPTPCTEWNVRHLVNHMARGNLNYERLLHGGSGAEFPGLRDADAPGADMVDLKVHERITALRAERRAPKVLGYCGSRSSWSGRCGSSVRPG